MADDTRDREGDGGAGGEGAAGSEGVETTAGFASDDGEIPAIDDKQIVREPPPADTPADRPDLDLFDHIILNLLADLQITPDDTDRRWPTLIAQAYRDNLARFVGSAPHGMLFRLTPNGMEIHALTERPAPTALETQGDPVPVTVPEPKRTQ